MSVRSSGPSNTAAKLQELSDLLIELSRWSRVAERNGDLHARIASALALESSAADESVGERQGRQPAQVLYLERARISEHGWDPARRTMIYRVEYDAEAPEDWL